MPLSLFNKIKKKENHLKLLMILKKNRDMEYFIVII